MVDRVALSQNEQVILNTTNNNITVVLLNNSDIMIKYASNVVVARLQVAFEMFTLAIGTGAYTVQNLSTTATNLLIVREFIY